MGPYYRRKEGHFNCKDPTATARHPSPVTTAEAFIAFARQPTTTGRIHITITTSLEKRQQNLKRASESPTMVELLKSGRGNPAERCWRYLKWKSKWKPKWKLKWKPKWKPMWKTIWISSEFPVNFFRVFSLVFYVQNSKEKIHKKSTGFPFWHSSPEKSTKKIHRKIHGQTP